MDSTFYSPVRTHRYTRSKGFCPRARWLCGRFGRLDVGNLRLVMFLRRVFHIKLELLF